MELYDLGKKHMACATSFPREKLQILFLEGIDPIVRHEFEARGYQAEILSDAMSEDELLERIGELHVLGIRSKTQISARVLEASRHLLALGCFCIGTNQVDLQAAARHGVAVFNAPFSNTRSVAELTVAEMVMLARKTFQRSSELHAGEWQKSAGGCYEVRHKTVGIIGYGHIGPQVGLLAEAFGMRVIYYDIVKKLPLGNAQVIGSIQQLLEQSDFVTLHVPETPETRGMFGKREISQMKQGSYLLNLSRGSVVDLDALREALDSGKLAGAAVDVYPSEPKANGPGFESILRGAKNVILTPHIGGSTAEAQESIAREVGDSLLQYVETGSSTGAVNFPNIHLPLLQGAHRVLHIHRNIPGVLRDVNKIVADSGANVQSQYLATQEHIGYLIMDVDPSLSREVKRSIDALEATIRTRLLF